ncbi:hypothetical protein U6A24_16010 [Aquimarina gracilis]|uniref:Uncharacterized protein n=1 Tax=Aquimarina gracilis TaxID=874422 RepID=A0ABU5ZYT3_9FLAO|nr:hypothetical protein [Aquimarina gracilis]MEB3346980.1 hypothetical protein [Aquimarina gracilis]
MRTLILSIINGFFTKEDNDPERIKANSIFLKFTDPNTKRTLIIEEDKFNVWVYSLSADKSEIDFEGFLCTVVSPVKSNKVNGNISKKEEPLPLMYTNKYSWIKNLKKEHIQVDWKNNIIEVLIRGQVYLIMDTNRKTSYSKALSTDCSYGKKLTKDLKF